MTDKISATVYYQQPWINTETGVRLESFAAGHLDQARNVIVVEYASRTSDPLQQGMIVAPAKNMPADATIGAAERDFPALRAAGFVPTVREG
jgi:hypothetical protein